MSRGQLFVFSDLTFARFFDDLAFHTLGQRGELIERAKLRQAAVHGVCVSVTKAARASASRLPLRDAPTGGVSARAKLTSSCL